MTAKQATSKTEKNLARPGTFKRGQDSRRNMGGRPRKAQSVTHWLREIGSANDGRRFQELAETLWQLALGGDLAAIRQLLDRLEGQPHQSIGIAPEAGPETPVPDDILAEMWDKLKGGSE